MAFRRPLIAITGYNLREMTDAELTNIKTAITEAYLANPSVQLRTGEAIGWVGIDGTPQDTRLQAGAYSTDVSAFPSELTTAEPSVLTYNYNTVYYRNDVVSAPVDTGKSYPVYYTTAGHLRAMSLQDVYDTFIYPAIDAVVTTALPYQITTSSTPPAGYTYLGVAFVDTRADTSLYTAAGIPEALDQFLTVQTFYLHKKDGAAGTAFISPFYMNGSNHVQAYEPNAFRNTMVDIARYVATNEVGYRIKYAWNPASGTALGSSVTDTRLNGSGNYQTYGAGGDDYRAQEFPDGSSVTINTYTLKVWRY